MDARGTTPRGAATHLARKGLRGLRRRRPGITVRTAGGPASALRKVLALAGPGDPVLLVYEKLAPVREAIAALAAAAPA